MVVPLGLTPVPWWVYARGLAASQCGPSGRASSTSTPAFPPLWSTSRPLRLGWLLSFWDPRTSLASLLPGARFAKIAMPLILDAQDRPALAHILEISPKIAPDAYTTSTQRVRWHQVPETVAESLSISTPDDSVIAVWSASQRRQPTSAVSTQIETPFVHIPHCRLDVTTIRNIPQTGQIEEVALPGPIVRTLLSGLRTPDSAAAGVLQHFDDTEDWVYSRCVQSNFSGLSEYEARRLSDQGRLCCWASIMLRGTGARQWDLCFVIHKVLARQDLDLRRCECP